MSTPLDRKSTTEDIRKRFDSDVERFSNLETGQQAVIDAPLLLDLISALATGVVPHARTLLDIGCGAGNNTIKILRRKPDIDCDLLDLSPNMLERAKLRVEGQMASPTAHTVNHATAAGQAHAVAAGGGSQKNTAERVRTFCGDLRAVSLPRDHYDIVVAAAVLHHLREDADWESTFAKIYEITAPGGALFVSDMFFHADPQVQAVMWHRYGEYLESLGGAEYRRKVFDYIDLEDSPRPMTFQLDLLRKVGFSEVDILHKNSCFGAYVAIKR